MRIKLTDGAEGMRLPSVRPPPVAQLTTEAKKVVSVVLSDELRALTDALSRSLTDTTGLSLQDVLTHEDRLLMAWATELARADGIDAAEVGKLVADLGRYRAQQRRGAAPLVDSVRLSEVLALPVFSAPEEAQARAILFGMATGRASIDPAFVRTLLDPDLRPANAVSFTFLQRIVAAMPPAQGGSAVAELQVLFARRDARNALSTALAELAMPTKLLVTPNAERSVLGAAILAERMRYAVSTRSDVSWQVQTTRNDRALLGALYASQDARGGDPRAVDRIASALLALRNLEHGPRRPSAADVIERDLPTSPRSYDSPIQLAAKAAVAYRSVAPPRPNTVPPSAMVVRESMLPAASASMRTEGPPSMAFNLAQALGLSALVADAHTQALRARRRRLVRKRDDEGRKADALDEQAAQSDSELDLTSESRTLSRWQRVMRHRRGR